MLFDLTIQYRAEASLERPNESGIALILSLDATQRTASIRTARDSGLFTPEIDELWELPRSAVPWDVASDVVDLLNGVMLAPISSATMGIHQTTHVLRISTDGATSCMLSWWGNLPEEWISLSPGLGALIQLGREHLEHADLASTSSEEAPLKSNWMRNLFNRRT